MQMSKSANEQMGEPANEQMGKSATWIEPVEIMSQ